MGKKLVHDRTCWSEKSKLNRIPRPCSRLGDQWHQGDTGGAVKTSKDLKNLQLHHQCYLRLWRPRDGWSPLKLIKAWIEMLLQADQSQRVS